MSKQKDKASTRNNILPKFTSSQWVSNPHTLRTSALALCFSNAEYVCPVWSHSAHARHVYSVMYDSRRTITECLKPAKPTVSISRLK